MHTTVVTAYIIAGGVCALFFLLALVLSNKVNFEPDKSDSKKRKIYFWVFNVLNLIAGFGLNYFLQLSSIKVPNVYNNYLTHMAIAAGVFFVLYIVIGFILSKVFNKAKVGTWF